MSAIILIALSEIFWLELRIKVNNLRFLNNSVAFLKLSKPLSVILLLPCKSRENSFKFSNFYKPSKNFPKPKSLILLLSLKFNRRWNNFFYSVKSRIPSAFILISPWLMSPPKSKSIDFNIFASLNPVYSEINPSSVKDPLSLKLSLKDSNLVQVNFAKTWDALDNV